MQEIITDTQNDFEVPQPPVPLAVESPTPNNPPWGGWIAFGVWVLSIALIVFVPLVFFTPYALSRGIDLSDAGKLREFMFSDSVAIVLQLAPIILAHALTLLICWFVVTKFNTYSFRTILGWEMNGFKWWYSILITLFFFGLAMGLTLIFGDVENTFEQLLKSSRYAVYLTVFFATFTAPLVEEVVYRGLLYSAFQRKFGMLVAVILVTLLFTAVHIPQYSMESTPDPAPVIALLLLSLTLTFIRAKTGNLLPCVILHTIFNASQSILLIVNPDITTESPAENVTSAVLHLFK